MATAGLRLVGEQLLTGRAHPVISALIETLPAPGTAFTAAERAAWLGMMETAFTLAYGGEARMARANDRARSEPAQPKAPAARKSKAKAKAKPRPPKPLGPTGPRFYIDKQGFARRAGGDRIMPAEVGGILVDQRGERGDLGAITWADDSTGIPRGAQLDIGIADGNE